MDAFFSEPRENRNFFSGGAHRLNSTTFTSPVNVHCVHDNIFFLFVFRNSNDSFIFQEPKVHRCYSIILLINLSKDCKEKRRLQLLLILSLWIRYKLVWISSANLLQKAFLWWKLSGFPFGNLFRRLIVQITRWGNTWYNLQCGKVFIWDNVVTCNWQKNFLALFSLSLSSLALLSSYLSFVLLLSYFCYSMRFDDNCNCFYC